MRPQAICGARAVLALLVTAVIAVAQQAPTPQPGLPTSLRSVRISFLPPPLEGTISLGIYDDAGKLVRVLHREAGIDDFEAGKDALVTRWDGKNGAGESMPPGKYHARGFIVGDVKVEGVGFFFNDWVTDETSPRIKRIENFTRNGGGDSLILLATTAGGEGVMIACDLSGHVVEAVGEPNVDFYDLISPARRNLRVESGKLTLSYSADERPVSWPELSAPEDASYGRGETVWVIDKADTGVIVKQFSRSGEFLRRLSFGPGEPVPRLIRASPTDDRLFLLEENDSVQRLRALTLLETKSENGEQVSDWKVDFEKRIVAHADFTILDGRPTVAAASATEPPVQIAIKPRPNPLQKDERPTAALSVGINSEGSFLQTADGLPLQSISETKHLTRVVLAPRGDKSLDVFQDDTAVVEQFRITALDEIMAFDCGEFELK